MNATQWEVASLVPSLASTAKIWLDPTHPLRQEAMAALQVSTGFNATILNAALNAAFQELTEEKILAYIANDPAFASASQAPEAVLHILAGNVFTSWLPGAVTTLLLGSRCVLKPSREEPVFASLWQRSLAEVDPRLAQRVEIVSAREGLLAEFDAVVAYGSDETLAQLQTHIKPGARFIGYGHKISVGVIWQTAWSEQDLLDRLEADIAAFHLQGCLSPQILYVQGGDFTAVQALAPRVTPMPTLKAFTTWEELRTELQRYVPYLSTLGVAGQDPEQITPTDRTTLALSRVCRIGDMQRPSLQWRNGGFSLAQKLI